MDNIKQQLADILMDTLPDEHPWAGRVCDLVDALIANGVTVQGWIPVSDPPKEWRRDNGEMINYLVYVPEFGVDIGNYGEPAKCWLCMGLPCKPTHWAHLPTPPKGVSEEALPVADEATERSVAVEKTEESASPKVLSGTANWR